MGWQLVEGRETLLGMAMAVEAVVGRGNSGQGQQQVGVTTGWWQQQAGLMVEQGSQQVGLMVGQVLRWARSMAGEGRTKE